MYYVNGAVKPGLAGFRFPFVIERAHPSSIHWVVWGISPASGTVLVQRRVGRHWRTALRFKAGVHGIFTRTIRLVRPATFRAQAGNQTSLHWSAG